MTATPSLTVPTRDPLALDPATAVAATVTTTATNWKPLLVHLLLPVVASILLLVWLEVFGGNLWIADRAYAWEGGSWLLREHPLTSVWIHPGGKYLSAALWCIALVAYLRARRSSTFDAWRRPLAFLLLSTLIATLIVALLKSQIWMDCAWDMQRYGGLHPYVGLFDPRPIDLPRAGCFPAGHASAGYAWVALYFFFSATAPRWRFGGLAFALLLGAIFGIAQQLRGAHFLSHDVASLMICWLTAFTLSKVMRIEPIQGTRR